MHSKKKSLNLNMGDMEQKILRFVSEREKTTIAEICKKFNMGRRRVSRIVVDLMRAQVIRSHTTEKIEYFTANEFWLNQYKYVFRWLIFFFSLPVLFFAGLDYLKGAYLSIKSKWITINAPVVLGMIALFIRSFLALLFDWGYGYFDSLSILINRWKEK